MTVEQLTLDLWATPDASDDQTVIAEITALADRAGWIANPTYLLLGQLDFFVSPYEGGPCTFATPDAARRMLTALAHRYPGGAD